MRLFYFLYNSWDAPSVRRVRSETMPIEGQTYQAEEYLMHKKQWVAKDWTYDPQWYDFIGEGVNS